MLKWLSLLILLFVNLVFALFVLKTEVYDILKLSLSLSFTVFFIPTSAYLFISLSLSLSLVSVPFSLATDM